MRHPGKKHEAIYLSKCGIRDFQELAEALHPHGEIDPEYGQRHVSRSRTYGTLAQVRKGDHICVTIDGEVVMFEKDAEIDAWAHSLLRRAARRHRDWSDTHGYRYEQLLLALDGDLDGEEEQPDAESEAL